MLPDFHFITAKFAKNIRKERKKKQKEKTEPSLDLIFFALFAAVLRGLRGYGFSSFVLGSDELFFFGRSVDGSCAA